MADLAARACLPCRGDTPALNAEAAAALLSQLQGWRIVDGHHLEKAYGFPDFASALEFVNRIGSIAEAEGHHPDLHLAWGSVRVTVWTHAIDALSESDFVLAAKIDAIR